MVSQVHEVCTSRKTLRPQRTDRLQDAQMLRGNDRGQGTGVQR